MAEDSANEAARRGKWDDFVSSAPSGRGQSDIANRARFFSESKNITGESLTGEELFEAVNNICRLISEEDPYKGFTQSDQRAAYLVYFTLCDMQSITGAKERIIARQSNREGFYTMDTIGPDALSSDSKNVQADGSLSPATRYNKQFMVPCQDYYVGRRARQYLEFIDSNPEVVRDKLLREEPELPALFRGPLYEGEDGQLSDKPFVLTDVA